MAIVATLVVAGGTTALFVLPNAEASDRLGTGTAPTKQYGATVGKQKIPPGARRVARGSLPKPGPRTKAFSDPAPQPRIVGGSPAMASNYPYIVGILTDFAGNVQPDGTIEWFRATCTGTIISPTKVMTAGHCATDFSLGDSVVIAGVNNLADTSAGYVARVKSTWTHPTFNLAQLNDPNSTAPPRDDVSVLTLKQPLPQAYTPVELAAAGNPTDYNETAARIVGYGITSNDPGALAGTLYEATVPIHSATNCTNNINIPGFGGYDNSRMLCAGTLGTPTAPGVDACHGDSGGPILVNNVEVGITDWGWGVDCAVDFYGVYERISTYRSVINTELANPGVINPDWSGDGHSDLIARNSQGLLIEYSGSGYVDDGFNGFNSINGIIGSGWNNFTKVFRVMNWDGDGTPAIFARSTSGNLYKYKSDGHGGFAAGQPTRVGSSWNGFADIMVTNNWTGNGRPNILGRTPNGDLMLYTSNGAGGWENNGIGIRIGTSWNGFNTVLTPGDWKGDGHQALIGRTPSGGLFLYESDGNGGWLNNGVGVQIGSGWNGFKTFMSVGDWGGDNHVDLIGIDFAGALKLYQTDGHGTWLNNGIGRKIGSGWAGFTAVF